MNDEGLQVDEEKRVSYDEKKITAKSSSLMDKTDHLK